MCNDCFVVQASVTRSTSDVSDRIHEEARKKGTRDKRAKLYNSDPFGTTSPVRRMSLREATLIKGMV